MLIHCNTHECEYTILFYNVIKYVYKALSEIIRPLRRRTFFVCMFRFLVVPKTSENSATGSSASVRTTVEFLAIDGYLQLDSSHGGATNFCMQKFLTGLAGLVYLHVDLPYITWPGLTKWLIKYNGAWRRFLIGNTNDGLIDCYSSQAIRCKQAKQVENSYFGSCCSHGVLLPSSQEFW